MEQKINQHWFGSLTLDNLEEMAAFIRQMLEGKRYTWVGTHEARGLRPEVRTGQQMKDPHTWYGDDKTYGGFHVNDSYGVWGAMTDTNDKRIDPQHDTPYIVFDYGKLMIFQKAPAGYQIVWCIALEQPADE